MDNVLDFTKGSKRMRNKERITEKYFKLSEHEVKNLSQQFVHIKTANELLESYKNAHRAWMRNADMAEILIDAITTNGLEDRIIELVKEQMELEREHDIPEHAEESYNELIHEYWHNKKIKQLKGRNEKWMTKLQLIY